MGFHNVQSTEPNVFFMNFGLHKYNGLDSAIFLRTSVNEPFQSTRSSPPFSGLGSAARCWLCGKSPATADRTTHWCQPRQSTESSVLGEDQHMTSTKGWKRNSTFVSVSKKKKRLGCKKLKLSFYRWWIFTLYIEGFFFFLHLVQPEIKREHDLQPIPRNWEIFFFFLH